MDQGTPIDLSVVLARLAEAEEIPLLLQLRDLQMEVIGSVYANTIKTGTEFDLQFDSDLTEAHMLWRAQSLWLDPFHVSSNGTDCFLSFTVVQQRSRHTITIPYGHILNKPFHQIARRLAARAAARNGA